MKVVVRFFASLREAAGTPSLDLELSDNARFDDLLAALERELRPEALAALRAENVRLAVNQELVTPPFALADRDEVAFLPPVTGG